MSKIVTEYRAPKVIARAVSRALGCPGPAVLIKRSLIKGGQPIESTYIKRRVR